METQAWLSNHLSLESAIQVNTNPFFHMNFYFLLSFLNWIRASILWVHVCMDDRHQTSIHYHITKVFLKFWLISAWRCPAGVSHINAQVMGKAVALRKYSLSWYIISNFLHIEKKRYSTILKWMNWKSLSVWCFICLLRYCLILMINVAWMCVSTSAQVWSNITLLCSYHTLMNQPRLACRLVRTGVGWVWPGHQIRLSSSSTGGTALSKICKTWVQDGANIRAWVAHYGHMIPVGQWFQDFTWYWWLINYNTLYLLMNWIEVLIMTAYTS